MKLRCQSCQKENTVASESQNGARAMCMHCGLPLLPDKEAGPAREHTPQTPSETNERTEITGSIKIPRLAAQEASQNLPALSALVAAATHSLGTTPGADPDVMWHVRLAGGGERGPVTAEQLQQWLQQGQISAQTPVWRIGMAQWQPFAQALPQRTPTEASAAVDDALAQLDGRAPSEPSQPDSAVTCAATGLPQSGLQARGKWLAAALLLIALLAGAFFWLRPNAAQNARPASEAAKPAPMAPSTAVPPPAAANANAAAAPVVPDTAGAPKPASTPALSGAPAPANANAALPAAKAAPQPNAKSPASNGHRSRSKRLQPHHKRRPPAHKQLRPAG